MLTVEELQGRTYEERMADNLQRIPLLSGEWTNYNPSDPGITILENLTAFAALQGSDLTAIGYRARMALLKMAGFVPSKGKCARVLLSPIKTGQKLVLPPGQRFMLGDVCYETIRETQIGGASLSAVYSYHEGSFHDISFIIDRELEVPAKLFGKEPGAGDAVYFFVDPGAVMPKESIFYVQMDEAENRMPPENRMESDFADISWEYYTAEGFKPMDVWDFTGSFVYSGELRLRFKNDEPVVYRDGPCEGYCIRAVLTRPDYDMSPRCISCQGFLFEVWQKETQAFCQIYQRADNVTTSSPLGNEVYFSVYAREEKGGSYHRYELTKSTDLNGRFVNYDQDPDGRITFHFDKASFGYAPLKCRECVRVVGYNEDIMRSYHVGTVIGYDDQEIELPVKNIVPESLSLIAKRTDEKGEDIYDFVRPGKKGDGALCFHLLENDGVIIIEDAGDFIGAELYMGSVATTLGKRGNVLPNNTFYAQGLDCPCYNPGSGTGGAFRETYEEVRTRYMKDVHTPYTAVSARDYEYLVRTTPGLCIKKAKAVYNPAENMVRVAVMPGTGGERPKLSGVYRKKIEKRLEERRLITTRFKLIEPVYAAVGVRCTVYVKRHYSDCSESIKKRIREKVDYTSSDRNFGDPLLFEDVFHAIEELDCVEYVYDLSLRPENNRLLKLKEFDIIPREDCLCYAGDILLETVSV